MNKMLKFLHLLGLSLFLGSIMTYVLVSLLVKRGSLEDLVFGRQVIRTGTLFLTLPGMWLVAITGIVMAAKSFGSFRHRWMILKLIIALVIILNAHVWIIPATGDALYWSKASLAQGTILPEYAAAYLREAIPGGLNVLLILIAMAAGIWKWDRKTPRHLLDRRHS